jgi:drug/metabolite transporter (DMT)-like permease
MRYLVLVFLGACSYGILSTIVKLAYGKGFHVGEVTGSQMFFGFLLTWFPALFFLRNKPTLSQWLTLLGVGLIVGSTGVLYYNSLQYIPASIAIVLLFQFTWMGVLLEAILTRKRPDAATLVSLLLLFVGTAMAGGVWQSDLQQFDLVGVMFGLLSAVTYTLFIFFSGKTATAINPWLRSAIMTTGAVFLTWILYPPEFFTNGSLANGLWLYGFLLALFGVLVPTLFFNFGVPHIGPGMATILGAAELPMAVFSSHVVLQEPVSLVQWIGVVTILAGIALPEWARNRGKKKTPSLS